MRYATSMFGLSPVQPRGYKSAQWTLTAASTGDGSILGCGSSTGRCFNTQMQPPLTKEAFRKREWGQDWKHEIFWWRTSGTTSTLDTLHYRLSAVLH